MFQALVKSEIQKLKNFSVLKLVAGCIHTQRIFRSRCGGPVKNSIEISEIFLIFDMTYLKDMTSHL